MKILNLEEDFRLSVETFFTFFFESSNFKQKYHTSRGDNQIEIRQWSPSSEAGRYTREVTFQSFISNNPVINKLVGDKAKVREVQYYKYNGDTLNVIAETYFDGSPIGKSFSSVSEWNVSPISTPLQGCKVVIQVKNNYKGVMFKGALENWVHDTTEDSFKQWLSLVRQQVEEYEKNEELKRITPTPVKKQNKSTSNNNNNKFSINQDSDLDNSENEINNKQQQQHIVDENHKSNLIKNQKQQQQQHQQQIIINNNNIHIHNNNNNEEDFSDSELSDISRKAPSHIDFDDDDEEEEEEEEEESDDNIGYSDNEFDDGESSNTKYYDSNDVFYSSENDSNIKNFMQSINNDISNLKSIIETNHNRLFGLEESFNQIQRSSSSPPSINNNSNNNNNNNNNSITTLSNRSVSGANTTIDTGYLTKLEEIVKNVQDEEIKTREKQKEWIDKINELEKKLNSIGNAQNRSILWLNILALIFFLIGWPIVAKKLWKTLYPFLSSLITKK